MIVRASLGQDSNKFQVDYYLKSREDSQVDLIPNVVHDLKIGGQYLQAYQSTTLLPLLSTLLTPFL